MEEALVSVMRNGRNGESGMMIANKIPQLQKRPRDHSSSEMPRKRRKLNDGVTQHGFEERSFHYSTDIPAEKTARFWTWMEMNHFNLNSKLCIRDADETGRGVWAKQRIKRGESLFEIDSSLLLSVQTSGIKCILEHCSSVGWNDLALACLHELSIAASKWKAYLDSLPCKLESPIFWDSSQLSLLSGTQLEVL